VTIDAVVFDWGGTLSEFVNWELVDAWRITARHLAPEREDEVFAQLEAVETAFWKRLDDDNDMRSGTLAQLLRTAADELQLDVGEALLEEAAVRHLDAWTPHIRHNADARPTLEAMRARGIRTALLSNTHWPRTFHDQFLERDGLLDLLDARLYTSELEFQKPHPTAFRAALAAVGVDDPGRAVMVGDRPLDDISGAARVGMRTVLIKNDYAPDAGRRPEATVHRLGEVVGIVDGWRSLQSPA
jgi:putative hydrolase of the HAD superfamily